ncbi:MAG: DUF4019 domain-containing protein [Acidobacteriota bacterium]
MKRFALALVPAALVAGISLFAPTVAAEESDAQRQAGAAATAWLAQVDAAQYDASWDAASSLFQRAVSKADWDKALRASRTPLGAVRSRKPQSSTETHSLPGAPDGDYVVLTFETSFENKASAVETLTPMREKDGKWKVSGYYIR